MNMEIELIFKNDSICFSCCLKNEHTGKPEKGSVGMETQNPSTSVVVACILDNVISQPEKVNSLPFSEIH